jgi:hypothetical protein
MFTLMMAFHGHPHAGAKYMSVTQISFIMCTMLIFKKLHVDSRGMVKILEGIIVRNELYEHMSNSEGYQDRNMNE